MAVFWTSSVLLISANVLLTGVIAAQQASRPARPAYDPNTHSVTGVPPRDIHIDQHCRILPDEEYAYAGKKKLRPVQDRTVCHLGSVLESSHQEKRVSGGQVESSTVRISEQEYVLQNVTPEPVVFVVEQVVPRDWQVDSDPRPEVMEGSTAIFKVHAEPGQMVRLHVGIRHARNKKT
jgi:hypothetical protein